MNKIDAIRKLREQVEAGEWDFRPDAPARQVFPYNSAIVNDLGLTARAAFEGSLDAAKALHDALLPGKSWTVCPGGAGVDYSRHDYRSEADNDNPARAWLIAILRALEAQEGGE